MAFGFLGRDTGSRRRLEAVAVASKECASGVLRARTGQKGPVKWYGVEKIYKGGCREEHWGST